MGAIVRTHAMLISVVVSLALGGAFPGATAIALDFGAWSHTTSFPDAASEYEPVEYNGYIYAVGGFSRTSGNLNSSYFARVNPDGSLGSWMPSTAAPESGVVGLTVYDGFLYASYQTGNVFWAAINSSDGSLGPWQGPSTPTAWRGGRLICKAHAGYIYVLGGFHYQFFYDVHYAPINADGSPGNWTQTTSSPTSHHHFTHFLNGRLYIGGGINASGNSGIVDGVYSIRVNPDGSLGDGTPQSWRAEASLPHRLWQFGTAVIEGRIYLFGGLATYGYGGEDFNIYEATIEADGTIVQWTTVGTVPGAFPVMFGAVHVPSIGQTYLIGGRNSVGATNEVWTTATNGLPTCDPNGPYAAECSGEAATILLDGGGSSDPDDDFLSYWWTTDCPGGVFDDPASSTPLLTVDSGGACGLVCGVTLTVDDGNGGVESCSTTVTIADSQPPVISCSATPLNGHRVLIEYGASDDCGATTGSAVIETACCPLPVVDGQVVKVECEDDEACNLKLDFEDDVFEIESNAATLVVTATDSCGNEATCEVVLCVPEDENADNDDPGSNAEDDDGDSDDNDD